MQLNEKTEEFKALGVNVAAVSYDSFEVNARFSEAKTLLYPLLGDVDAKTVSAFGILNNRFNPGHMAYGVPHPGVVMVDKTGTVRFKAALEDYRKRPDLSNVLTELQDVLATL